MQHCNQRPLVTIIHCYHLVTNHLNLVDASICHQFCSVYELQYATSGMLISEPILMPFGDFSLIVDQSLLILQIMHYIDNTISDVLPQQMNYLLPILSTQSDQIL